MYPKKLYSLLLLLFLCQICNAQPFYKASTDIYDTVWENTPSIYTYSPGHGALILSHVMGSTGTGFYKYLYTIKINAKGDSEWVKRNWLDSTFVFTVPARDSAGNLIHRQDTVFLESYMESVIRLAGSGNYIIGSRNTSGYGILLRQIDSLGNLVSSYFLVDTNFVGRCNTSIKLLPCGLDSFYILYSQDSTQPMTTGSCTCSYATNTTYIRKMTGSFSTLWSNAYRYSFVDPGGCPSIPMAMTEHAFDVKYASLTQEGGLVFARTYDTARIDTAGLSSGLTWYNRFYLEKLRPDGTIEWTKSYSDSLNIPAHWWQYPTELFITRDSGMVSSILTEDTGTAPNYIYRLIKFSKTGAVVDSIHFTSTLTAPYFGTQLLNGNLLFVSQNNVTQEFYMYDKHLNFLYAMPQPFSENGFCMAGGYYGGPLIPNQYGGAFCAYFGGNYSYMSTWHSLFVDFDSSFNCYPSFVTGTITQDSNYDCIYNSGDLRIAGSCTMLHETGTGADYYGFANDTGYYAVNAPYGNYALSHPASGYERNECGAYTVSITAPATFGNNTFFDTLVPGIRDLILSMYSHCMVPGDTTYLFPYAYNNGTTTVDTTISIILDHRTTYISSTPAPFTVSGDTITYRMHILSDSFKNVAIKLRVNTSVTIGDTMIFLANSPFPNNQVPSNDSAYYSRPVVSSYDPNQKSVNQRLYFHRNNTMVYTVEFQNTGTYSAKNVVILDTLDRHLDPGTFRLLSSTHALPQVKWLDGNRLMFIFSDIHLPDSTSNPLGSHGAFSYSIKPRNTAALGDTIHNTAYIYFDYNLPIRTNTTRNILAAPSLVNSTPLLAVDNKLDLYPNPTTSEFVINAPDETNSWDVSVTDISGRVVQSGNYYARTITMKTDMPAGLYFVKLTNTKTHNYYVGKLVVVK